MSVTNSEILQVVHSSAVVSVRATVLADEITGCNFVVFDPAKRASLCGFTNRTNRTDYIVRTHKAVKALHSAGSSLLASRELAEQELKIENLTALTSAAAQRSLMRFAFS